MEQIKISPYAFVGFKYDEYTHRKINPLDQKKTADYYIETICSFYGEEPEQLKKKNRSEHIVITRNICIWFIRKKTKLTLKAISDIFKKDHTTIIHALQTVESQLSSKFENQYKDDIEQIKKLLWVK